MRCRRRQGGFTLIEVLVASAILIMMVGLLFSLTSQVSSASARGQVQQNTRQAGRAALELITRDLEAGIIPLGPGGQTNFTMNSQSSSMLSNSVDNIFWKVSLPQGNGSSSVGTSSDIGVVGYFVLPPAGTNDNWRLCRLYVNTNSIDGAIESLTNFTANSSSSYQGLVAEGVLGLWINLYTTNNNTPDGAHGSPYSATSLATYPTTVDVAMVIADTNSSISQTSTSLNASGYQTPESFVSFLTNSTAPATRRVGRTAQIMRTSISVGTNKW